MPYILALNTPWWSMHEARRRFHHVQMIFEAGVCWSPRPSTSPETCRVSAAWRRPWIYRTSPPRWEMSGDSSVDSVVLVTWGYHHSWMVYFMENPNLKWMLGGVPLVQETTTCLGMSKITTSHPNCQLCSCARWFAARKCMGQFSITISEYPKYSKMR